MGLTLGNAPLGSAFLIEDLDDPDKFVMWVRDKNGIYFSEDENVLDNADFIIYKDQKIKIVTDQLEKRTLYSLNEYQSFLYDGFYYYKSTSSSGSQIVIKPHSPKCMDKSVTRDCQVLVVPDDYTNFSERLIDASMTSDQDFLGLREQTKKDFLFSLKGLVKLNLKLIFVSLRHLVMVFQPLL